MSEQTSALMPAALQAPAIVVFVSEFFENNKARKPIAASEYRDSLHRDR
jgi:hypothetical protein